MIRILLYPLLVLLSLLYLVWEWYVTCGRGSLGDMMRSRALIVKDQHSITDAFGRPDPAASRSDDPQRTTIGDWALVAVAYVAALGILTLAICGVVFLVHVFKGFKG